MELEYETEKGGIVPYTAELFWESDMVSHGFFNQLFVKTFLLQVYIGWFFQLLRKVSGIYIVDLSNRTTKGCSL